MTYANEPKKTEVYRDVVFVKINPSPKLYEPPTYLNRTKLNASRKALYDNRTLYSITNKHTNFNKNIVKKFGGKKVYTNAKLDEFRNKMKPMEVLKSGILKQYTVNRLQKLTGLKTNKKTILVSKALVNLATHPIKETPKKGILERIKNARIKHIQSRLNQANKLVKESQNSGMNKSFPRLYKGLVAKRNKLQSDLKKAQEPQVRLVNRVKKLFGRSK